MKLFVYITFFFQFLVLNGSAQWSIIHSGSEEFATTRDLFFIDNDYGYITGQYSGGSYVLRTHDGGENWDSLSFESHQFRTIYMTSVDTGYISCFHEGQMAVLRTIDAGDSWQMVASELHYANAIPYAISFFDNDTGIISVQGFGAITTNAGVDWEEIDPEEYYGYRDNDIGNNVFVSFEGPVLTWSEDRGINFHTDILDYHGGYHSSLNVLNQRFVSSGVGSNGQVLGYPNFNFGIVTIGDIETEEFNVSYFPDFVRVYGVSRPSPDVIYAICRYIYSEPDYPKFFMKSIDGGESWYFQDTEEPGYYGTREMFCVNDSVCFAWMGFGDKIYKTTNGGGPLGDPITQIPLSISDLSKPQIAFELFPNPAQSQITIQCDEQIVRIEFMDVSGRVLQSSAVLPDNGILDISAYPAGIYLVRIETEGGFGVRKLVVD